MLLGIGLMTGLVLGQSHVGWAANQTWTTTGSLHTAHLFHTATLLSNGKVLVAGGTIDGRGSVTASAELYDPSSGTWTATDNLHNARAGHTATLLPNGKVLVAGGAIDSSGSVTASAELYDPTSGTWTTTDNLHNARAGHTATLLPNGKVLVTGGGYYSSSTVTFLASAELYDPSSGTWTATDSLHNARAGHTATLLPNSKVLVAGGAVNGPDSAGRVIRLRARGNLAAVARKLLTAGTFNGVALTSAELYDPSSGHWTATDSLHNARAAHTATLLPNGKVLVAGGVIDSNRSVTASAELYDPAPGTWATTDSLTTARAAHTATLLPNGKVLVTAGGRYSNKINAIASAELYDPAAGTWATTDSLNIARLVQTATLLPDGKVLAAGGYNRSGLSSAELYDASTKLANISTRLNVGTGDNVLIGGFIVTGPSGSTKKVMLRGMGPSLSVNGVPIVGRITDPLLELHKPDGTTVTNDNWADAANKGDIPNGFQPTDSRESVIITTLAPGAYTVIMKGAHGETGVGLVEAYDLDQASAAQLANISTRGFIQTGDNVMIGGFIVTGPSGSTKKVMLRGMGPSLSVNGVPIVGRITDPLLELHKPDGTTVTNDNWADAANKGDIPNGFQPTDSRESVIITTLAPGAYTVIMKGAHGETGVGLVEAYQLDN